MLRIYAVLINFNYLVSSVFKTFNYLSGPLDSLEKAQKHDDPGDQEGQRQLHVHTSGVLDTS